MLSHVFTFAGHSKEVKAVTVLCDGRVASCGFDGSLRLWSLKSWRQEACAMLDTTAFALAPFGEGDGSLLLVGCGNHAVYALDTAPGATLRRVATLHGHEDAVFCVAACGGSGGAALVASGSRDRTVRVHDLRGGRGGDGAAAAAATVAVLRGHRDSVTALSALPDGMLASASADASVRVWDIAAAATLLTLTGHTRAVLALALLPSLGLLASAGEDGTVRLWALQASRPAAPAGAAGAASSGTCLQILVGGDCANAGAGAGTGAGAGAPAPAPAPAPAVGPAPAPGGAAGAAPAPAVPPAAPAAAAALRSVWALAATPSGLLAAAGDDGIIRLWDAARGICIGSHRNAAGGIHGLDFAAAPALAAMGDALTGGAALATANFDDYSCTVLRLPPDVLSASAAHACDAATLSRRDVGGAGLAGMLARSVAAVAAAPNPPRAAAVAQGSAEHDVVIELS
jgi:WD40 repeat protein